MIRNPYFPHLLPSPNPPTLPPNHTPPTNHIPLYPPYPPLPTLLTLLPLLTLHRLPVPYPRYTFCPHSLPPPSFTPSSLHLTLFHSPHLLTSFTPSSLHLTPSYSPHLLAHLTPSPSPYHSPFIFTLIRIIIYSSYTAIHLRIFKH